MPRSCSQFSPQPRPHRHWTQDSRPIFLHHHLQGSPAAGKGRKGPSSPHSFQRGRSPADALISGFWPLEPERMHFCCFELPVCGHLLMGAPGNQHKCQVVSFPSRTLHPTLLSQCGWPRSDPHPGHPGSLAGSLAVAPLRWTGLLLPGQCGHPSIPSQPLLRTPLPGGRACSRWAEALSCCGGGELVEESESRADPRAFEHLLPWDLNALLHPPPPPHPGEGLLPLVLGLVGVGNRGSSRSHSSGTWPGPLVDL